MLSITRGIQPPYEIHQNPKKIYRELEGE